MTQATHHPESGSDRTGHLNGAIAGAIAGLILASSQVAQAQSALGVPFVGRNHLSISVTELSRDGTSTERAAVYGAVYGRRLNSDAALVQVSVVGRAAARELDGPDEGIVDGGLTLAATHRLRAVDGLSFTAAAGVAAQVWAIKNAANQDVDPGRIVTSAPLSAGVAYDIRMGRATLAPYFAMSGVYSTRRDYVDGDRTFMDSGWRAGRTVGVSLRLSETTLSLSEISRERGMGNRSRVAFSAGMSW